MKCQKIKKKCPEREWGLTRTTEEDVTAVLLQQFGKGISLGYISLSCDSLESAQSHWRSARVLLTVPKCSVRSSRSTYFQRPSAAATSVFHCAVHMQLICRAVKRGSETLMSWLLLPAVVLRLSVSELAEQRCPLWAVAFEAPEFPKTLDQHHASGGVCMLVSAKNMLFWF